jgi:hypothetical protein
MILKTYQACNLPVPGDDGLKTKSLVLCEDLEDIPDNELDHCFRQARLNRNDSFFPSTGQIITAWDARSAAIRREKENNAPKMIGEPTPEGISTDVRDYIKRPTPEKLAKLREKYPNAGF